MNGQPPSSDDDRRLFLSSKAIGEDSAMSDKDSHEHNESSMRIFDDNLTDADREWTVLGRAEKLWGSWQAGLEERRRTYGFLDWMTVFLPCVGWLRTYSIKENLWLDLITGVSIAFMVVPQGMSYALLANLPAVWGLYGAMIPNMIYSLFGSSRHLAVGPVAVTSLLLGHALHKIIPESKAIEEPNNPLPEQEAIQDLVNKTAMQVAALVGICYFVVAIFRLSYLANFLSHSVISGFTSGAACIIGITQLKYFFGVKIPNTETAIKAIIELIKHIEDSKWREMLMFAFFLTLLLTMKKLSQNYKKLLWMRPLGPITSAVLGILAVVIGKLDKKGLIKTVKSVPEGLPNFTAGDWLPVTNVDKLIPLAMTIFLVDFLESLSISRAIGRKYDYPIYPNREVTALGFSNFVGAMFGGYPSTGSFSRTAVAGSIGAKTTLQCFITGLIVMFVLLFMTPVFERMPFNVMGAIIVSGVIGLFEGREAYFLFKTNFTDFLVWSAAFLGTFFGGVEIGLGTAIGLALLLVIYQVAFPHTALLGRLPETDVYRNIKQYPSAQLPANVVVIRVDAPIYFANLQVIRSRIGKYSAIAAQGGRGPIYYIVLDMAPVPFVDSTGMHFFHELIETLTKKGQRLVLANPSRSVQAHLRRVQVLKEIGQEWVFVRTVDAVKMCQLDLQNRKLEGKLSDGKVTNV